ncbi:MAG: hypothetical protein LBS17_03125 [Actinomycetes bacterium]|nr:hypothetical protein [Actinomycetes bacterium]
MLNDLYERTPYEFEPLHATGWTARDARMASRYLSSLPQASRDAITEYTDKSTDINLLLRKLYKGSNAADVARDTTLIQNALKGGGGLPHDTLLTRGDGSLWHFGLDEDETRELIRLGMAKSGAAQEILDGMSGEIITSAGFVSTSYVSTGAPVSDIVVTSEKAVVKSEIAAPSGMPAYDVTSISAEGTKEQEVLCAHGCSMLILNARVENWQLILTQRMILPHV